MMVKPLFFDPDAPAVSKDSPKLPPISETPQGRSSKFPS